MGSNYEKNMAMVDFRFPLFEHFWTIEGHWDRMVMLNMMTNIEVFSIDMTSNLPKHYPDSL